MAFVIADRVRETSTTTGTGTFSLAGAVDLCRTFVAGIGDGNTTRYVIEGAPGTNEYEIGEGVVTDLATDTLSRLTVIKSSNANALVNFSAGTKNVFCDADKSYLQLPRFLARPTASQFLEGGEYAMVGVPMTWDAGIGLTMEAGAVLEARVPYAPAGTVTSVASGIGLSGGPITTTGTLTLAVPNLCQGRLTLTTALPVTTADVLAATTVYFTPHTGDEISLYNGTIWAAYQFTEQSIPVTNTQSTTASTTSTVLTVADSSQMMRGMVIASTQVTGGQTIVSITNATTIVMSAVANGDGTSSTTFKIPASKNVDIFGVIVSGVLALRYGNFWSSDTARADALGNQNGKNNVNNAAINSADSNTIAAKQGLYLGTIRTTATAGQTEDSFGGAHQAGGHRYVWNMYNRRLRSLGVIDTTDSWTYTTATWRQTNAAAGNKVEFVLGLAEDLVNVVVNAVADTSGATGVSAGVGIDSTTVNSALTRVGRSSTTQGDTVIATYKGYPALGYHAINQLEFSSAGGTTTWRGDAAGVGDLQSGLQAEIMA